MMKQIELIKEKIEPDHIKKAGPPDFVKAHSELVERLLKESTRKNRCCQCETESICIDSELNNFWRTSESKLWCDKCAKWFFELEITVRDELFPKGFYIHQARFNERFAYDYLSYRSDESFEAQAREQLLQHPELQEKYNEKTYAERLRFKALLREQFDLLEKMTKEELIKIRDTIVREESAVLLPQNSKFIQKMYLKLYARVIIALAKLEPK